MFTDIVDTTLMGGQDDVERVKVRRSSLLRLIQEQYPDHKGSLFLFAPFEPEYGSFIQDSNFYYCTNIEQEAVIFEMELDGQTILYEPWYPTSRLDWIQPRTILNEQTVCLFGIDIYKQAGLMVKGYSVNPYFHSSDYQVVIERLQQLVHEKKTIFTVYNSYSKYASRVQYIIDRFAQFVPGLSQVLVDISPLIASLRRKKDMHEIEAMYHAATITDYAFQAAASIIRPDLNEAELQAAVEYLFTQYHALPAYGSIIASGKQATILHYRANSMLIKKSETVLIDAGAMYQHYCADVTRVYPASGKFSAAQKKIYEIVLQTQEHVVDHIKPGMYLINPEEQDRSLQHIAIKFLEKRGYAQYFKHGIGHYLGLDVHDVGLLNQPLQVGDVITIEPGIYIEQDSIGVRIEDNYWISSEEDAPVCLTENIVKSVSDVEQMIKNR